MADAKVTIDLELVTQQFKTATDQATRAADSFATNAKTSFSGVGTSFAVMAGSLAASAITKALGLVVDSFGRMMDEAKNAEEASNSLSTALKQNGNTSEAARKQLDDYASGLSAITTLDDDLITKNQALIASLTNLSTNGVNQATLSAANLAATLGIDLNQATDIVVKAINGKATPEMKGLGIVVKNTATDSENLARVTAVLGESNSAAANKTNTYSGAMVQQDNALGNLLQSMGELITQNPTVIDGIKSTTEAFKNATLWVTNNKEVITSYLEILKSGFVIVYDVIAGSINGIINILSFFNKALFGSLAMMTDFVSGIISALVPIAQVFDSVMGTSVADSLASAASSVDDLTMGLVEQATLVTTSAQIVNKATSSVDETLTMAADKERLRKEQSVKDTSLMIEATKQLRDDNRLYEREANIADDANELVRTDTNFAKLVERLGMEKAIHAKAQLDITTNKIDHEKVRLQIEIDANKKKIEDHAATQKAVKDAEDERRKYQKEGEITFRSWDEQNQKDKISTVKDTLGSISTLTRSKNKELFIIGKAAAITQATIDGFLGVQKALASLPPPFNFVAAGLVGAAAAINVSNIASQKMPAFAQGGIVNGNSFGGDKVVARVNSGEMILNRQQQTTLLKMANGNGSNRIEGLLVQLIDTIQNTTQSIQIDGREIVNVVRNGLASGRTI